MREEAGNLAREYLQARILAALQETGAMIPLAFQGGTALLLSVHGQMCVVRGLHLVVADDAVAVPDLELRSEWAN
jgi:hypothetical protein